MKAEEGKYQVKLLRRGCLRSPSPFGAIPAQGMMCLPGFSTRTTMADVFHVCQAFFPRTGAWENLKKALRADYNIEVWDHLAGTVSAPF